MTEAKSSPSSDQIMGSWLVIFGVAAATLGFFLAMLVGWEMHGELSDSQKFGRALFLVIAVIGVLLVLSGWFKIRANKKKGV